MTIKGFSSKYAELMVDAEAIASVYDEIIEEYKTLLEKMQTEVNGLKNVGNDKLFRFMAIQKAHLAKIELASAMRARASYFQRLSEKLSATGSEQGYEENSLLCFEMQINDSVEKQSLERVAAHSILAKLKSERQPG